MATTRANAERTEQSKNWPLATRNMVVRMIPTGIMFYTGRCLCTQPPKRIIVLNCQSTAYLKSLGSVWGDFSLISCFSVETKQRHKTCESEKTDESRQNRQKPTNGIIYALYWCILYVGEPAVVAVKFVPRGTTQGLILWF